ncbi:hypothetical protein MFLO_15658 [Listeria floridensis FSL S10-1187]|uniref:Uncharacterized protein n=1 Tax=Listeria floridensis FSL S10-1187 TaxID=1265817 RepID=A0ABN0RBB3_9LIST|nr:hypothetical protein [Listeria floridensis]EUJ24337.1 hypothetical protein MFLO_15658 [Listeria floridensis FSL S10-1187]
MNFKRAMQRPTPEQQKNLEVILEKVHQEEREKILSLGYTDEDIEKGWTLLEKYYEGLPNFVHVPSIAEFMEVQYDKKLEEEKMKEGQE